MKKIIFIILSGLSDLPNTDDIIGVTRVERLTIG
jgi:hypothetical protein